MPLIYETPHFTIEAPREPHVSRTDGGHMVIYPRRPVVHRWDLDPPRAKLLMRLSMLAGQAMVETLNSRGIAVQRINFQDNGNWGIDTPKGPHFHLHLYGRARGSVQQAHGEALYLPHRETRFWEALEPLDEEDCRVIAACMNRLADEPKYQLEHWT